MALTPEQQKRESEMLEQKRLIDLDRALTEILMTCRSIPKSQQRPFFFIVGAGISYPPVPLAAQIIKDCQEQAKKYYPEITEPEEVKQQGAMASYDFWMGKAFSQRGLRQAYLKEKIDKQYITKSNVVLAHLLLDNTLTNLVVTTNFDNFLSRALALFNKQHIICDHPKTATRIDPHQTDLLQLIHVHGSYLFYDSSNLSEEIEERAGNSSQMPSLLSNFLWNRSPLVIGYSGWENDIIMKSLSRRLESDLLFNLYWFCYKYEDAFKLPKSLYENSQVYFVVPRAEGAQRPANRDGETTVAPDASAQGKPSSAPSERNSVSKRQHDEFSLPSDVVLGEMVKKFELERPAVIKSTLPFMADQMRNSISQNLDEDFYLFKNIVEDIEQANVSWQVLKKLTARFGLEMPDNNDSAVEEFIAKLGDAVSLAGGPPPEAQPAEAIPPTPGVASPPVAPATPASTFSNFDNLLDALRGHRYVEAINLGKEIPLAQLTTKQLKDLMDAMWQSSLGLYDNSQDELNGYETVIKIGKLLMKTDPAYSDAARLAIAKALFNKGRTYYSTGEYGKALDVYTGVVAEFSDAKDTPLREQAAKAFLGMGATHDALGQHERAIVNYDDVVKWFGDSTEPSLQTSVGVALYNKGVSLADLDRKFDAIKTYDEMAKRFRDSTEPRLRKNVVNSLNNAAYLMLCDAKRIWQSGDERNGKLTLSRAVDRLISAHLINPVEPLVLGNLGYVSFLLGNRETAENYLKQAIAIGGEEIYRTELDDAEIFPLPQDEDFKKMLHEINNAVANQQTQPSP
ncbi:MAG TPA: SIR2 family protein [Pyrinomonadaceae bacterium]|jgi:tetratricopeptide (TPR) repeat protein|nr:SIR2 family protein [Pyrinomonadaceae bacterium]